jgi:TonB family protein
VAPEFPKEAFRAGFCGAIVIEAIVGADGKVESAKVVRGMPLLNEPAVAAVRQCEYEPQVVDGVPTPFVVSFEMSVNGCQGLDAGLISGVIKSKIAEDSRAAALFVADRAGEFDSKQRRKLSSALQAVLERPAIEQPQKDAAEQALRALGKPE